MSYRYVTALAIALTLLTSSSQAGILTDLLTFSGDDVILEDNSRGLFYDEDGNGVLSAGDVVAGLMRIDRRVAPTATASMDDRRQLIFAYSLQVETVEQLNGLGIYTVDFGPTAAATGKDLASLLGEAHKPAGFTDWDKAALVVMEQTFAADDVANNPVSNTSVAGATLMQSVLGSASGYTLDIIAGFDSEDDFYQNLLLGAPGISIPAIRAAGGSVTLGTHSGGLSVLYDNLGENILFQPVVATTVLGGAASSHDIGIEGGILFGNDEVNWDFADKANFRMNVIEIPEPNSLTLCGLLVGLFGLAWSGCRRAAR